MKKIANYGVNGSYIFEGRKGVQRGEVDFYDDGKLLGKIGDEDFNYPGISKNIFFGLYVPDRSLISFVKFPLDERLMPVMWSLTSESMHSESKPHGWYSGFWEFLHFREQDLPFEEFQNISDDLTKFENASVGLLNSLFFNDLNLDSLQERGSAKSQKGRLEFIEI